MKTCIWAACHLTGNDANGDSYAGRYQKYLQYYRALKTQLGFDDFVLIDNASSPEQLLLLGGTILDENLKVISKGDQDLRIVRCKDYLPRGAGYDYPYCWRSLYAVRAFMKEYDKFLFIDSDCFVLTERMAKWMRELESGWKVLWCNKYGFPEAALSALCRDAFHILDAFCVGHFMHHNGSCFETTVPYTHVVRHFNAERYGEEGLPQYPWMDYYGQARLATDFVFQPG